MNCITFLSAMVHDTSGLRLMIIFFLHALGRAKCGSLDRIVHKCLDPMTKCDLKLFKNYKLLSTQTQYCWKLLVYSKIHSPLSVMLFNIYPISLTFIHVMFCIVYPWSERDLTDFIIKLIC